MPQDIDNDLPANDNADIALQYENFIVDCEHCRGVQFYCVIVDATALLFCARCKLEV